MDRNYDVISFILKYVLSEKTWSSQFCWHHQNCNHFIKAAFKDSKKLKRIRKYAFYICFFWHTKNWWFPIKKGDISRTQGVFTWFIYFLTIFKESYTVPSFIIAGHAWQILERVAKKVTSIGDQSRKAPS